MRAHGDKVTPERKFLTMETPFMEAYVQLLIHTCHRRGAFAMGGMAAQIPVKNNPRLAAQALESVKKDKVTTVIIGWGRGDKSRAEESRSTENTSIRGGVRELSYSVTYLYAQAYS